MSSKTILIFLVFWLISCSLEVAQDDLNQDLLPDPELECEFYSKCGFSYHPSKVRIDYGNLSHSSAKPTTDKSGLVYQLEQTSGLSSTNIKFDSQTGVISWDNNIDPGEYRFRVSAYDIVSDQVKSYNHQANFTLIVSVKPISEFSYPQNSRVLFYKNSGRSQKPSLNSGLGPLVYRLTTEDGRDLPDGVRVLDNGQIEWEEIEAKGTNDLVVIASNFGGSKTARYRLVVSNQLDADRLGVFLNTQKVIATYGTSLSMNLLRIEGLAPGLEITDAFSLELTNKDEVAIPSEINLSPEGLLEIAHDVSRSYLQVGSESNYLLKLGGKAYDYADENKKNKAFSIEMLPKPITSLGGGGSDGVVYGSPSPIISLGGDVSRGGITYDGPVVTTQEMETNRALSLPDDFLVGSDTWLEAVDFSILRENEMLAPESIEIDAWGKISFSKEVAVDDSGNYLVRVEGKGNYVGRVDIPVGVMVHRRKKIDPLVDPLVKVDFYGRKISGISMSDRQMGLGDLLWKENWIMIKPSGLDSSKNYQVVLRDDRGGEVKVSGLGNSEGEIRVGAGDFDLEAKKKLILLNKGKITVDLLLEGDSIVPPGERIFFTKAFRKIRNWRDLQAIDFAPALTNDYTLMNPITLPTLDSDGGLVALNNHKMTTEGFNPIGDMSNPFKGTFDGNNYRISGLSINRPDQNYVGLFGMIEGSGNSHVGVRDLTLELSSYDDTTDIAIVGNGYTGALAGSIKQTKVSGVRVLGTGLQVKGASSIGGLVGVNNYNGRIISSYAKGNVEGEDLVGGLVGYQYNGKVIGSYATGDVTGSGDQVGGLVGVNYNPKSEIISSYATGEVSGNNQVGGLVGQNRDNSKIISSYATGDTIGDGDQVGGLVGDNVRSEIKDSYAKGNVEGKNQVGGLVGGNYDRSSVKDSYATGEVTGSDWTGGLVGVNDFSTIKHGYSIGRVSGNTGVGGLVGRAFHNPTVISSYWDKGTNELAESAGGTKMPTEQMKEEESFTNWDFEGIWEIRDGVNQGYPYLRGLSLVDIGGPSTGGVSGGDHRREISSLGFNYQPIEGIAGVEKEGVAPEVEGLTGSYHLSEIGLFRILQGGEDPPNLRMNHRGRIELKEGINTGDSGTYQVEITGRGLYQGVTNVEVEVEINPPPRLSDRARVFYQIVRTYGEEAKGYLVSRSEGVPEGDRTYHKRSSESWWRIDSDTGMIEVEAVAPSGDYEIGVGLEVAGYTGEVVSQVRVGVKLNIEISFYGKDDGSAPDRQMGLGDLLWKKAWVKMEVPTDGDYRLTLIDSTGGEVTPVHTGEKQVGEEVSFGAGEFNYNNRVRGMLLGLKEGAMTAQLERFTLGDWYRVTDLSFTKALREVRNWRDLQAIDSALALTNDYTLMNDITLPAPGDDGGLAGINHAGNSHKMHAKGFDPIGDEDNPFTGTFDGKNNIIKNLRISRRERDDVGLFGRIIGSGKETHVGVRDLTLELSSYDDTTDIAIFGNDYTGALAGYIEKTKVTGVRAEGSGQVKGSSDIVGGLVGVSYASEISYSSATGSVNGNSLVGGLLGWSAGDNNIFYSSATGSVNGVYGVGGLVGWSSRSEISRSYATGPVNGDDSVGGLVGDSSRSEISRSYATGSVNGVDSVGGLVGRSELSPISRSYATGSVNGGDSVGGLVGYFDNRGVFIGSSYWDRQTTGQPYSSGGGEGKRTSIMKQQGTFTGWDFVNTWAIDLTGAINHGYPYLKKLHSYYLSLP